ncbi:MAG: serine hydrolase domain-containing protein [Pseudomonadota bacterium]
MKTILFALLIAIAGTSATTAATAAAPDRETEALSRPGHVLEIRRDGRRELMHTEGAADIEQRRAIDEHTVFHIASLSKQITAATLAHAILDGLVSLEDPVANWVPAVAKYGDGLTVAHLLYMTSGLTEYYERPRPGGAPWSTFHYFTIDDAIAASLSAEELAFAPGTAWGYSNINYMLIAKIVEAAYEKRFADIAEERLFAPLGMSATLVNDDVTTLIPNRANAYVPRTPEITEDLRSDAAIDADAAGGPLMLIRRNAPHYGGSGVMTSMADWGRWLDEMQSRAVFGEAFWTLMLRTERFAHDKTNDSFGLVHGVEANRPMLWYAGGDIDASSYMMVFPDEKVSISCFSNAPRESCREHVEREVRRLFPG